jgi:hypothetical protein
MYDIIKLRLKNLKPSRMEKLPIMMDMLAIPLNLPSLLTVFPSRASSYRCFD